MEKVLQVAKDVSVQILDRETNGNIKVEALPNRKVNLAKEAILAVIKKNTLGRRGAGDYNTLSAKNPVIQAVGVSESLDLRYYQTQQWSSKDRKMVDLPADKHEPYGSVTSLFLNTVHDCFSNHYALGIRPEALMYMILHEIGITVKQNAEYYRHLFTESSAKQLIEARVDSLDIDRFDQVNDWMLMVNILTSKLREKMPSNLISHLLPDISTHDENSKTASMIAVLDAASPFYDYLCSTCCGIPSIRLFGCGQDYDNIVEACEILARTFEKHLGNYFKYLLPVLKEIADTVNNRKAIDNDFWSSIYNHYSGSGTNDADGWITAFINYVSVQGTYHAKASGLYDWKENLKRNKGSWGRGINRDVIPNHISAVPFIWNYFGTFYDCRLMGGFLAVEDRDGYATPTLSWAVVRGDEVAPKTNSDGQTVVQAEDQTPIVIPR